MEEPGEGAGTARHLELPSGVGTAATSPLQRRPRLSTQGTAGSLCPHGPQSCLLGCWLLPREPSTRDKLSAGPSPPLRSPRVSQPPACCGRGRPPFPS